MKSTEDFEEVDCLLCGSAEYKTLFHKGKFNVPLNLSICQNCGLAYLNPRWKKERYDKYYREEYDLNYRVEITGDQNEKSKYSTAKVVAKRLEASGVFKNAPTSVLDIGSGMGWTLDHLKRHHFSNAEYAAIEPSPDSIVNLKKLGVKVVSEDADANWHEGLSNSFDLVIMRHVLEHFLDPIQVLKKLRSVLSENGVAYIAVPNAGFPSLPFQSHFVRAVHTTYFTKTTLKAMLEKSGLKVLSLIEKDKDNRFEMFALITKGKVIEDLPNRPEAQSTEELFSSMARVDNSYIRKVIFKIKNKLS